MDPAVLNYEVDSEDEWGEEPEDGEELASEEEDEEDLSDDELSEEEGNGLRSLALFASPTCQAGIRRTWPGLIMFGSCS